MSVDAWIVLSNVGIVLVTMTAIITDHHVVKLIISLWAKAWDMRDRRLDRMANRNVSQTHIADGETWNDGNIECD